MTDVFPELKAQICNEIESIVAELRQRKVDNRHEGKRHANSLRKHLGTTSLMEADYDKLIEFREHLLRLIG